MRGTELTGSGKREAGSNRGAPPGLPASRFPLPDLRGLVSTLKTVLGMPDYDRYLAHRRACHPGEPVQSRREHYLEYVKRRYGGGGGRCC